MTRLTLFILLSVVTPALAQPADETGTGGGPSSTITTLHTASSRTTKPPGDTLGPLTNPERRERSRIEQEDNKIDTDICIGCSR